MERGPIETLERLVSVPRLQRYRDAASTELEVATLYCWNIKLAEALMPALSTLEVTLRNSVHDLFTAQFGTEFWFKSVLHKEMYKNIIDLIANLTSRLRHPPTAAKVISEITFGFWPRLFAESYNQLWWSRPDPPLAKVLANHPDVARDTRKDFQQRLEYFVRLRNRAMHQEAVFQGIAALNRPVLPIDMLHSQLLETIDWINPDAATMVACLDDFNDAFLYGRERIEAELNQRFGF